MLDVELSFGRERTNAMARSAYKTGRGFALRLWRVGD